ncbi:MAG: methyltransferase domain-containing protein [Alphaproteobacteria bacterium]|nr:methyltransferase domain-containing protein [Alphaproteobacteria bacterium]
MHLDIVDLHQFYADVVGQTARRLIRHRIRELWPSVAGQRVLGLGFATPYLRMFRAEAERVIALMPATQGVSVWPRDEKNVVGLCDEAELPLPTASLDRVIMVHTVELSEQLRPMLREVWRVLTSSGRLIAVVPNRLSIWARVERTPFGNGSPFSQRQLDRLLRETMFAPQTTRRALFLPPTRRRSLLAFAPSLEDVGERWLPGFGGVMITEAGKQIYALSAKRARHARRMGPAFPAPARRMR